ncbi:hypothetical protein KR222_003410 [Zaprionus bogoriensis]|nr:hypothetical protein KR222_003410 [Zaprionus bogoriensis]
MRILQIVIVTLIAVYPDDVLSKSKKRLSEGPCGKKFMRQINDKCYFFAAKKMNWFGAQNNCLRKGLQLADLSTASEFNAIIKFLRSRGAMEDYWFGGNDLQSEGRFTYISNGRAVKYLGEPGIIEPTQRSNLDDCLEVRLRTNTTTVTDDNCLEQQYFICQRSDIKCAHPVIDRDNTHHSHEHLHHFHHNPGGRAEKPGRESEQGTVESDSRPADNSNSTEIGESPEQVEELQRNLDVSDDWGMSKSENDEGMLIYTVSTPRGFKKTTSTHPPERKKTPTAPPAEGGKPTGTPTTTAKGDTTPTAPPAKGDTTAAAPGAGGDSTLATAGQQTPTAPPA